jgi:hypothetical protein
MQGLGPVPWISRTGGFGVLLLIPSLKTRRHPLYSILHLLAPVSPLSPLQPVTWPSGLEGSNSYREGRDLEDATNLLHVWAHDLTVIKP